ncbi:hypothetical protein GCM10023149_44170 [Mucilaginibacter gynuensis]|uniref:Lipocalin-like protein n=1 Tax=Mucilaginibacter gynuensis TaxID=1302236 RepID=A0ABP8H8K3_9SPHI
MLTGLASCISKRSIPGIYVAKGKDYIMELGLNQDSTFNFHERTIESKKKGRGKWKIKNEDTLILKFINTDVPVLGLMPSFQDYQHDEELKLYKTKGGNFKYLKATFKKR